MPHPAFMVLTPDKHFSIHRKTHPDALCKRRRALQCTGTARFGKLLPRIYHQAPAGCVFLAYKAKILCKKECALNLHGFLLVTVKIWNSYNNSI